MAKADLKYKRFMLTVRENDFLQLPSFEQMEDALTSMSDSYAFQLEVTPTTNKQHYQCCLETRIRKRISTLLTDLQVRLELERSQIQVQKMEGTWEQAVLYCTKDDTRHFAHRPVKSKNIKLTYSGKDLEVLDGGNNFYPWQRDLFNIIFQNFSFVIKSISSREVIWIEDLQGNSGKSLFVKWVCYNCKNATKVSFGSGSQLRASIVDEGIKSVYFIDVPRQLATDDSMQSIFSVIEDTKNGFIKSSMYGKSNVLFMDPPVVVIFSNFSCPTSKLSVDRWKIYAIINNKLVPIVEPEMVYKY